MITREDVLKALARVEDPDLHKDIVSLGFVKDLKVAADSVSCTIELTTPACPVKDKLLEEARRLVASLPGVGKVDVRLTAQVRPKPVPSKGPMIPEVKNVIAVASGKGGVGKSTVSANLAIALTQAGARVGLMDADVYGPSIPTILGIVERPASVKDRILPVERYGVKVISMGFFIAPNEAVIWRGPMLHKMVQDFLTVVEWGELDYLIVDLPPGTGDIQLSLCQTIPLTGAVIVSTPQDVAWNVAQKAIVMFDKLNAPVLGIIENMSHFVCNHCGATEEIFGSGTARRAAERLGIPYLGEIPIVTAIRQSADEGDPVVHADPESLTARDIVKIAENLAAQVSIRNIRGDTKIVPVKIGPPGGPQVQIEWSDGSRSLYPSRGLREQCPCAQCVDEFTGVRTLDSGAIPQDIRPLSISAVGRYALHIAWSDGHATGLYGFEYLRKLSGLLR